MRATSNKRESATAAETLAAKNGFSLVSGQKLIELYAAMVKCRMIAERAARLFQQGKLSCDFHAAVGREAVAAGVALDLLPEDALSPSPGDVMACILKGAPLEGLFKGVAAPLNGHRRRRAAPDRSGYAAVNVIPPSSTAAAQLNVACGVALASKMKKDGKIAVVFCADGSGATDSWHEALTFARIHELPILFICQNGAQGEPEKFTPPAGAEEIGAGTLACGVPAITVEASDAVAVYRVAYESIARARRGRGPTLIDCQAYRLRGQTGTGIDPERLEARDPVQDMETYLSRKGLFDRKLKRQIAAGITLELDAATRFLDG